MNERMRDLLVGLTTTIGLVSLLGLMLLFGYIPTFLQDGYEITIELPTAAGLHEESEILLNGIKVGHVKSIEFNEDPFSGVNVVALIKKDILLPLGVFAEVQTASLLGGGANMALVIDGEQYISGEYLPVDGSAVIGGEAGSMFAMLTRELKDILERPLDQIDRLADEWVLLGQNLNHLAEPRTTAEVDSGDKVGNLATIFARLDTRLIEAKKVLEGMQDYVCDEQLRTDIKQTASNANKITTEVADSIVSLRNRYVALADDVCKAVDSIQEFVDRAKDGDGTISRFINDPSLYNNLDDASERIKSAIDEMKLLMQKWKAEGLPVQF